MQRCSSWAALHQPGHSPATSLLLQGAHCAVCIWFGDWGTSQPCHRVWGHAGGLCCVLLEGLALPAPPAVDRRSVVSSLGKTWRCFPGSSGACLNYLTEHGGEEELGELITGLGLFVSRPRCRGQAVPAALLAVRGGQPRFLPLTRQDGAELARKNLEQGRDACELGSLRKGRRRVSNGLGMLGASWDLRRCWAWGTQSTSSPLAGTGSFVGHTPYFLKVLCDEGGRCHLKPCARLSEAPRWLFRAEGL